MSKKMKVLIAVLVAVLTLALSGTVAVLAQEEDEPEPEEEELLEDLNEIMPGARMFASTESSELLSRVAEILGISEEELSDAFAQAKQEMLVERYDAAFNEYLERAIAEGLITEEEAEDIREWWEQRPEALNWARLRNAFGMMRPHHESLNNKGYGPAALNRLSPKSRIMNEVRGRHMIAVPEGWHGPRAYPRAD